MFQDARLGQGIVAQAQPNAPVGTKLFTCEHSRCDASQQEDGEHAAFIGYPPQQIALGHVQAAIPDPFAHRIPVPGQPAADNLKRLASRYLFRPDSQVSMVCMEPGAAGHCKVVIILEMADIL
jgi:hypothetical protein